MGAHGGAVDHGDPGRVLAGDEGCEQLLPQAALAPPVEAVEHGRAGPVCVRQRTPAQAFAKTMQDAAQHPAIVHPRLAAQVRQYTI